MGYISTLLSLHINSPIGRSSATKPRNMTKEPLDDFRYRIPNGNEFEVRVQVRKINIIKSEILYKQTERTTTHIEKASAKRSPIGLTIRTTNATLYYYYYYLVRLLIGIIAVVVVGVAVVAAAGQQETCECQQKKSAM